MKIMKISVHLWNFHVYPRYFPMDFPSSPWLTPQHSLRGTVIGGSKGGTRGDGAWEDIQTTDALQLWLSNV